MCAGVVLLGIFRLILKLCETFHSGQNIQAVWLKYLTEREGFLLKYYNSSSEVTTMVDRMRKEGSPSEMGKSIEGGNLALLHAIAEAFIQKEYLKTPLKSDVNNGGRPSKGIIVGACVFGGVILAFIIFAIYDAVGSVMNTLKCIGILAGIIAFAITLVIFIPRIRLKVWLILLGIAALIGIGIFIAQMVAGRF